MLPGAPAWRNRRVLCPAFVAVMLLATVTAGCDVSPPRSNAATPCQDTISIANAKALGFDYDQERSTDISKPDDPDERNNLVLFRDGQRVFEANYVCTESGGGISFTGTTVYSTNR